MIPRNSPYLGMLLLFTLVGCSSVPSATSSQQQRPADRPTNAEQAEGRTRPEGESTGRHRHHHRRHGRGGDSSAPADPRYQNTTGNFDFYLLSLSWSPGFCATAAGQNDPGQCAPGRKFSFVLHGLWPQYEQKGWPQNCSTEPIDPSVYTKMISIMPSEHLIQHEWSTHGTCSGLTPADYFEEATEAFHKIKVPAEYQELATQVSVSPDEVRQKFAAANPALGEQGFVVTCSGNGRYLAEVHACLTKDIEGRPCNREELAHQCRSDSVIMRPVR